MGTGDLNSDVCGSDVVPMGTMMRTPALISRPASPAIIEFYHKQATKKAILGLLKKKKRKKRVAIIHMLSPHTNSQGHIPLFLLLFFAWPSQKIYPLC